MTDDDLLAPFCGILYALAFELTTALPVVAWLVWR